ncbi:MAG TPA: hypothetical protein P5302_03785 [Candidatus Paceibacterota bacterium]|nr:hypothetical protein [Candidatus Paceibacterota bacterium]
MKQVRHSLLFRQGQYLELIPHTETIQLEKPIIHPRSLGAQATLPAQAIAPAKPLLSEISGIATEPQTTFACKINSLRTRS